VAVVISDGQLARIDKTSWTPAFNATGLALYDGVCADFEALYAKQANVRLVVDFLARNVAQLGLKVYRRLSDTDREHLPNHPLARLLNQPNSWTARYDFFDAAVHDLCIFGNCYWLKRKENGGTIELWRLPPSQVTPAGPLRMRADVYEWRGNSGRQDFPAADVVHLKTYNPVDPRVGLSPLESLRRILAEDEASGRYREAFWKNRARPEMLFRYPGRLDEVGLQRLRESWDESFTGEANSGRTAILEEGADVSTLSQSFHESQYLEVRRLTREEVAAAFHVSPLLVGMLERSSYSNMQVSHKALYTDSLAPLLRQIEENLLLQLLPEFTDRTGIYAEFNLEAKLRGAFEEAATQLQTSVGAPYMSRNEARARLNLPHIEGADELITPMNVTVGGQASPTDSAPPPKSLPQYRPAEDITPNGKH
jgi:HK97 family phage portal protein